MAFFFFLSPLEKLYDLDIRNTPGVMHGDLNVIFAIPSLSYLYLSGLHLSGEMPRVLPQRFLQVGLTGNSISGRLPETFESNTNLNVFNVANNQLVGDVPGDLPLLPNLQMVDVSQNRFSSTNHGKQWPEIRPFSGEQELVNSLPEFHRTFQHNG